MKTDMTNLNSFQKAKKRLERLKSFYTHLSVFLIVNGGLIITYFFTKPSIFQATTNKEFIKWVDWNVLLTPIIWGVFLIAHASCVFQWRLPFLQRWEERQYNKIIEKENQGI
ncbi:2TM domain-containing protein [Sediminicola sp. YIK13]|uniref:2TM domain-containing protein n=1 Tax=Sediminicola sp. YIK13 TaxID=1453352 RepID=UPI0007804128|nr:2TM domain-containing protein [Sediminicola sp. YIK13]